MAKIEKLSRPKGAQMRQSLDSAETVTRERCGVHRMEVGTEVGEREQRQAHWLVRVKLAR